MAIGASLWGLANFSSETGSGLTKPGKIGCQYRCVNLTWMPGSPVFAQARASGLRVGDWQNVVLVNMLGKRFYDETGDDFTGNQYPDQSVSSGQLSQRQERQYNPNNFINAAMAGIGDGHNGGGPIWAIFDADAVSREHWTPEPPHVDLAAGFFSRRTRSPTWPERS